jgi:iron-sulfur cluster repair protein YtfE (RIC family)
MTTEPGWALTRLLNLHHAIRSDLALLDEAVTAIADGGHDNVAAALARLSVRAPGWTLREHCATFCTFVHEHHATEDAVMFPMLLEQDSQLGDVVDRLKAGHQDIARDVDEVLRTVRDLPGDAVAREAATNAVSRLSERLRVHLDLEERLLAPALNAVSLTVSEDDVPAPPPERLGRR